MFLLGIFMWLGNIITAPIDFFANRMQKPKVYTAKMQYKYEQKVLRNRVIEDYKRSLLPESGYMTREEYNDKSKEIPNKDRVIEEYKPPHDINMQYVPQYSYKLVRYNSPPGTAELKMSTKLKYDRKFVCPGIVSPQKDFIVYPVVFYYAQNQCSAGELFTIQLDKSLPDVKRVQMANLIKANQTPILSTEKDISEKFILRTMTPVDFSQDGTLLIAKEKIGNINDGVWQTNLWYYNFRNQKAIMLPEIREAIKYYWMENKNLILDEKRWDIFPLGFSQNNDEIIVTAYGYTGGNPKFLGTWSTDLTGENVRLISIDKVNVPIQENGYKLVKDIPIDPAFVHNQYILQKKEIKNKRKAEKKALQKAKSDKKKALNKKLKEMKAEERKNLRNK